MHLIFCSNLGNGVVFFQQFLNHLGFEIGCMLSFHALIVSYPASFFGLVLGFMHTFDETRAFFPQERFLSKCFEHEFVEAQQSHDLNHRECA